MSRAQVTIEFVMLFVVALLIASISLLYIVTLRADANTQVTQIAVDDFAYALQQEFSVAATMHDGFHRTVELPERINGNTYSISILNSNLYVSQAEYEVVVALPPVTGSISGTFTITKENGEVLIT